MNVSHIFTREFPNLDKIEFFRKVLYLLILFNAFTLLPVIEDVYGYYGLVGTKGWNVNIPIYSQGTTALINVLNHPANSVYQWVYLVFVIGQIAFLITGIMGKWPRISAFMVFIITINLNMKGHLAFTGGEVLLNMILFYLMFIHKPKSTGVFGELQNILNNTFYWILLLQVCVLYFFSAVYKLYDPLWVDGSAMMYISQIDAYSSSVFEPVQSNYWLSAVATYLTLAYQLLFPIAVWIKKIKTPYLIFGVIFHLIIALGMGIFHFGMIMIVAYILFLNIDQINWIRSKFKRKQISTPVNT